MSTDKASNVDAIANLKKFRKALEIKRLKNPKGIDWFAVNLAINAHNARKKNEDANVETIISAEVKKHGIETNNTNLTDYKTDVSLLSLKREDAIKLLEKNNPHKLLPADSKESLLVRAILYGVEEIAEKDDNDSESFEQFKMLFDVEMTEEIKEILQSLNTAHPPEGDTVLQHPGSTTPPPGSQTRGTPSTGGVSPRQRNPSISSISSDPSGSSNDNDPDPLRPLGGRGTATPDNTDEKMPEDTNALALAIISKCRARPTAFTRTQQKETALRNKIHDFVNLIIPTGNSAGGALPADSPTISAPQQINTFDKLALQALWKAKTNAHRGKIIDIVQFMKENEITEIESPWKEALKNPNDTTIETALEEKSKREKIAQLNQRIEMVKQMRYAISGTDTPSSSTTIPPREEN